MKDFLQAITLEILVKVVIFCRGVGVRGVPLEERLKELRENKRNIDWSKLIKPVYEILGSGLILLGYAYVVPVSISSLSSWMFNLPFTSSALREYMVGRGTFSATEISIFEVILPIATGWMGIAILILLYGMVLNIRYRYQEFLEKSWEVMMAFFKKKE